MSDHPECPTCGGPVRTVGDKDGLSFEALEGGSFLFEQVAEQQGTIDEQQATMDTQERTIDTGERLIETLTSERNMTVGRLLTENAELRAAIATALETCRPSVKQQVHGHDDEGPARATGHPSEGGVMNIKEARAIEAKRTPGEWPFEPEHEVQDIHFGPFRTASFRIPGENHCRFVTEADGAFIAMTTDPEVGWRALADRVQELTAALAAEKWACERLGDDLSSYVEEEPKTCPVKCSDCRDEYGSPHYEAGCRRLILAWAHEEER